MKSKNPNQKIQVILQKKVLFIGIIWLATLVFLVIILFFSTQISDWLSNLAFIKILDALSKLGILIGVTTFLFELPKQEKRAKAERRRTHFEYWKAIDTASASNTLTSYARKIALEDLASEGVSLRNVDTPNADLRQIDLTGADLTGANLYKADLTRAKLEGANLSKANLYGARLYGASLLNAKLENTDLRKVLYDEHTQFSVGFNPALMGAYLIAPGVSLEGAKLTNAILWGVNLQDANLEASDFSEASFRGALLKNTNLQRANLKKAKFGNANLEGAKLDNADIEGASFWNATGLTVKQVKSAKNWETAEYSQDFGEKLD